MASFRKLAENLGRLAQVPSRIAPIVVAKINAALASQFSTGQDPYGTQWAALLPSTVKRKRGDTRVLLRSDRMAAETIARPTRGAGIELVTREYGRFHQSGTKHMVSRPVLPARADLPLVWRKAIGEAYSEAFGKAWAS